MIRITGHIIKDNGPHCSRCQSRSVRFHGAYCSLCRADERDRNMMGIIVAIFLAATLLVMGFISAHATFVAMN